jgi:hypothetical protein
MFSAIEPINGRVPSRRRAGRFGRFQDANGFLHRIEKCFFAPFFSRKSIDYPRQSVRHFQFVKARYAPRFCKFLVLTLWPTLS